MAREIVKPLWTLFSAIFLIYLVNGAAQPQVPCYFIFGDSLSDSGNNNGLFTVAKANFRPYGIDFPRGPTGRFSNGRNLVDAVAELLGLGSYIPPFATARGKEILKGVNYASGSAGIRNETGRQVGQIISMAMQLQNHQSIVKQIASFRGNNYSSAEEHLGKCIYSVGIGTNDYFINYFVPLSSTSRQYTPQQYARVLIEQYSQQLRTLYNFGARKIVLFGLGAIGSAPSEVAACGTKGSSCVAYINSAVQIFNGRLKSLVQELNSNLRNAKFIYIDYYGIGSSYALSRGSLITNVSCCGVKDGLNTCIPFQIPCRNRTRFMFWDGIHPTEATNVFIAARAYKAEFLTDAFPYDIHSLAQLS
ncbi:hypothetical protein PRUPE_1G081200 [Prunus persica]|uniref:Uncharacterized protein n=1 Tax=Prunus persica TaxID=3760 RepID=A0A251QU16_PRUPE|nr:GDSL esterase/lipase At1g29670 [Prunus persica]ONI27339.1 hypothetical protein PRUPE_1G081200 [Prunus persica]